MILWLGLFKLSYSNSRIRNKIAMLISSHTRVPVSYSFSLFATVFYSSMPLLGSLILSKAFGFSLLPLFTNYTGATALPVDILIGLLAVMSIDSVPLVMPALLYLDHKNMYPVQLILRNIVISGTVSDSATSDVAFMTQGVKYAAIFVTIVPILFVYPFVQKYFTKGIMVGSLKG